MNHVNPLSNTPFPDATEEERPFWMYCGRRELRFQRCNDCKHWCHPPMPVCPKCQSKSLSWQLAPQRARVYSFTVVHHASHPAVADALPYVVALVQFDGLGELRFLTNLVGLAAEDPAVDMPVQLTWRTHANGTPVPCFVTDRGEE